jgi:hypothetical protein
MLGDAAAFAAVGAVVVGRSRHRGATRGANVNSRRPARTASQGVLGFSRSAHRRGGGAAVRAKPGDITWEELRQRTDELKGRRRAPADRAGPLGSGAGQGRELADERSANGPPVSARRRGRLRDLIRQIFRSIGQERGVTVRSPAFFNESRCQQQRDPLGFRLFEARLRGSAPLVLGRPERPTTSAGAAAVPYFLGRKQAPAKDRDDPKAPLHGHRRYGGRLPPDVFEMLATSASRSLEEGRSRGPELLTKSSDSIPRARRHGVLRRRPSTSDEGVALPPESVPSWESLTGDYRTSGRPV